MSTFWVPGVPVGKGSLRAFTRRGGGVGVEEGNADKVRPWMSVITLVASERYKPTEGAVAVRLHFYLPRPKGHLNAKGALKPSAPRWPAGKPDVDKIVRAVLDALTGVCWVDDAQVVELEAVKRYALPDVGPGLQVTTRWLGPEGFDARPTCELVRAPSAPAVSPEEDLF